VTAATLDALARLPAHDHGARAERVSIRASVGGNLDGHTTTVSRAADTGTSTWVAFLVMPRAKRHHYVPASYLTRFGEGGKVLVRPRGRRMYVTSVINVAVEAGFYEVRDAEGEPTDAVERALAGLEGTAGAALTTIEQTQQLPPNGSVERETLATFLAVQFTRTPDHRELILFPERVAKYAADRAIDADLMTEYLQKVHLGFKPQDGEVRGPWTSRTWRCRTAPP